MSKVVGREDLGLTDSDYAALFAVSPRAGLLLSPELVVLDVNAAYLALVGGTEDGFIGRPLLDAWPLGAGDRSGLERLRASLRRVVQDGRRDLLEGLRYDRPQSDGRSAERYWDFAHVPVMRNGRLVCIHQGVDDATDRILAAQAAEARFQATFEQHAVGIAHVSIQGRFIEVNGHICAMLGYDRADLLSRTVESITHPDDLAMSRLQADLLLGGAVPHYTIEKRYLRADGQPLWVSTTRSLVRGASNSPERFVLVVDDISARKDAERALQDSELRLRSILDTVPDGMVVIDQRGTVESFSRTAERIFGYAASEVVGRNVAMLMPDGDRERHDSYVRGYLDTAVPRIIGIGRTVAGQRKDGSRFDLHLSIGEARLGDRRMFVGFMRDLTERQRTEARLQEMREELAHLSRLTALGEMASALAHEINQPLTAITSLLRGSRRLLELGLDGRQHLLDTALRDAGNQALRAGQIIRRLRDFVTRGDSVRRSEDLESLVKEACALALVGAAQRGVRTRFSFDPAASTVDVDRIQIQQVIVNLVRNAIEAMEDQDRRELRIATEALPGDICAVSIEDTGPGLAPEVANRLFQAFVTTKPDGMGVGLSICRTIVEAHEGSIKAFRNPAGGTTFRFTLPAAGSAHG